MLLAGQVQEDEVVDSKILPYCSIDKKVKKSLGELEQEFLQALQVLKLILLFVCLVDFLNMLIYSAETIVLLSVEY